MWALGTRHVAGNMAAAWKQFKTAMKEKKNCKKGSNIKKFNWIKDEIIVQRLSSEVSGRAQKYTRMGPREFVPFEYEEVTFDNIQSALEKFCGSKLKDNMFCDILAGEQGPSCMSLEQIPDLKVIHFRIIERTESDDPALVDSKVQPPPKRRRTQPRSLPVQQDASAVAGKSSRIFPKSLSVLEMLKLGKVIKERTSTIIELSRFDIKQMAWYPSPSRVEFCISKSPIGKGGFREAFQATSSQEGFNANTWVVKKYLPDSLHTIELTGQTPEQHTQKVVQMHHLARNFALQLRQELCKRNVADEYGEILSYNKIFIGKMEDGEFVTVEEFVSGNFEKYINNDGSLCGHLTSTHEKAESLCHYSYVKSQEKLMVVDVQGSGHKLFDPEIASSDLIDDDEYLFSTGNLTINAITTFLSVHKCNIYCKLLGLVEIEIDYDE